MQSLNTQEIERKLQTIVGNTCGHQNGTVPTLDQTLEQCGADSLDYIDLILSLEDELGIEIKEEAWEDRVKPAETTLEQIAGYLEELVEAQDWK